MIVRVGLASIRKPMPTQTERTKTALETYDKTKIDFQVYTITGTHCVRARNIAAQAKPINGVSPVRQTLPYDYYLSMDDDMAFVPETIERLIAMDKDVIGAAYQARNALDEYLIASPPNTLAKEDWFKVWDHGVKECRFCGAGCLLIKKQVFEAMDYPWFRNNILTINNQADVCTEDVSFCEDATKAGFKIYVDLDNRVAHINT
jgi:hypothetical protein